MSFYVANRSADVREVGGLDFIHRIGGVVESVAQYRRRRRAEAQLRAMDDRMLADIGLSRSEIGKKVWGA
jgi:uncharacterized protein YjiS (DUF1127 family)